MSTQGDANKEFQPTGEAPKGIKTRQNPILPGGQLDKRKVLSAIGVVATLLVYSLVSSCGENKRIRENKDSLDSGHRGLNEALAGLPSEYPDWKRLPTGTQSPSTLPGNVPAQHAPKDPWLLEQQRLRRKRALDARDSDISFKVSVGEIKARPNIQHSLGQSSSANTFAGYPGLQANNQDIRDEANRQDDKREFLESTFDSNTDLRARLKRPKSPYELKAGTVISGLLIQGINSDLPGHIRGQVSEQIYDSVTGEHLLIPQGTKAIGRYDSRVTFGQKRLLIVWNRLIFPNGTSINLEVMPGTDSGGYAGLTGKVDRHFDEILFATLIGSGLGAGAQIAEGSTSVSDPSFGQLALQGASRNINQVGQKFVDKTLNLQPTITIEPGVRFTIFVTKDITLEPYRQ